MVRQLSDEVCDGVRADVRAFLASRPDLTMADLAQYTTLTDVTVRQWMCSNIPGGREVISEMSRVLQLARAGDILAPGGRAGSVFVVTDSEKKPRRMRGDGTFYETETVRRVAQVLDYCVAQRAIGVITADFGTGKTCAVNAWRRGPGRQVNSLAYEFDEFTSTNKTDFIESLGQRIGADTKEGSVAGGYNFRSVCDRLRDAPCLLIFDQCETVRPRICQIIRQIWDRTNEYGVGVAMLAAPVLLGRLRGSRAADLGALESRIGIYAALSGVSRVEMAAVIKQEGITDIAEDAFDLWWRATGGSMRRLMRSIELLKAKHAGKRVVTKTIVGVAGHLWGMSIPGCD